MQIKLRTEPKAQPVIVDTEARTIEELLKMYQPSLPFKIYCARLNNWVVRLSEPLTEGCEVVFLDVRDPSGKHCYQNSIQALYIRAAELAMPGAKVHIENSLNQGIFTRVGEHGSNTQSNINALEKTMRQLTDENIPFDDFNHDYNLLAPSTGYIKDYELRRCRRGIVIRIPEDTHAGGLAPYRDDVNLYNVFEHESNWHRKLGIKYCSDLDKLIDSGEIEDFIHLSEALHTQNIVKLAENIIKSKKRLVLIAGPSSSGKTTFAHRLCTQLWVKGEKPVYMGTDDYFLDRSEIPFGPDGTQNFEDLEAIDVELFNSHLRDLLDGKPVDIPRFDFGPGKKVFGERIVTASPNQPIVVEGIHGLNDALTPQFTADEKFKIYISPLTQLRVNDHKRVALTDIRKIRRIVRDANFRGWDAKQTIEAWPKVREGEDKNIFPYSQKADAIFNSCLLYELCALKKYAKPLLEAIPQDDECFTEAHRLIHMLNYVKELPDDKPIVSDSILREFIGGSIIV